MGKFIELEANGNTFSVRKSDIVIVYQETPYQDGCIELRSGKTIVNDYYTYNALMKMLEDDNV